MARARKLAEYRTTAGNVFQRWRQTDGRTTYRKNGRFTSSRAYTSGLRYSQQTPEDERTIHVQDPNAMIGPNDEAAYWDENRETWVAGPDANIYDPRFSSGDEINYKDALFLRRMRTGELNFVAFWRTRTNRTLSRDEAIDKYRRFLDAIKGVKGMEAKYDILRSFGWDGYE